MRVRQGKRAEDVLGGLVDAVWKRLAYAIARVRCHVAEIPSRRPVVLLVDREADILLDVRRVLQPALLVHAIASSLLNAAPCARYTRPDQRTVLVLTDLIWKTARPCGSSNHQKQAQGSDQDPRATWLIASPRAAASFFRPPVSCTRALGQGPIDSVLHGEERMRDRGWTVALMVLKQSPYGAVRAFERNAPGQHLVQDSPCE